MYLNKVLLAGNLTRDVEVKTLQSGMSVAEFGLAINRKTKDKEETVFVDVVAFGKTAESIAEHFPKGRNIFIEGRLRLDTWQDPSGNKRSKLCVICEDFKFVDSKPQSDNSQPPTEVAPENDIVEGEGVPF